MLSHVRVMSFQSCTIGKFEGGALTFPAWRTVPALCRSSNRTTASQSRCNNNNEGE